MWKALIKKEIMSMLTVFYQGKDGKRRSKWGIFAFIALMVYSFGALGVMFWGVAQTLCEPLVTGGMAWVYFAFMSVMATAMGVVCGIFMAKAKLYETKDNDLLLSMPISPNTILFSRISGLYLFIFLFEFLVFVPAIIEYFLVAGVSVLSLLFGVIVTVVIPLGSLAVCCLLGFVLAWITSRIPFKNAVTIVVSLAFMVVYFLLYSKMNEYLAEILVNGGADLSVTMQSALLYPFAQVGKALTGEWIPFLLAVVIFGGVFALVLAALSSSYLNLVTMKRGEKVAKYKERELKEKSPYSALMRREFLRLIKTPAYLLNASIGTLIMLIISVVAVIQQDLFGIPQEVITAMGDGLVLLLCGIVCLMASSNFISACSVSLEGNSLWIIKSLPVSSFAVLKVKTAVHFVATVVPAIIFGAVITSILGAGWTVYAATVVTAVIASAVFALMGLCINLKFPSFSWTNETVAVKQGIASVIAMFGGWAVTASFVGLYVLFGKNLNAWLFLSICLCVLLAWAIGFFVWMKKRGTKIFENL